MSSENANNTTHEGSLSRILQRIKGLKAGRFFAASITRWLLSKKTPLCKAVMDIVGLVGHEDDIILTADKHQIEGQPEGTCLFAARKAIGWLFTNPVSCSSFIVSLIEVSSNEEIE